MAWEYFSALNTLIQNAQQSESSESCRRMAMLAVIQAVTVGEVFLNLWFRVRVENHPGHRSSLLADLQARKGLEHKLKKWPPRYLSHTLNLATGPGRAFWELKELRNSLVHFTSSFEDVHTGSVPGSV